jgi:chemotaxis response regulator CheB
MTASVPRVPRVLVTGEFPIIRTAIARWIASDAGLTVAGDCPNHVDALAEAMRAVPDVVVIDSIATAAWLGRS